MTINTVAQAQEEEAALVAELKAKLPTTLNDERIVCGTFYHHEFSRYEENKVFYIHLSNDHSMKRYMLLVQGGRGFAVYWVENSKESYLGNFDFGAEELLDAFLHLYLSARYKL